jgi:hypothetical protein
MIVDKTPATAVNNTTEAKVRTALKNIFSSTDDINHIIHSFAEALDIPFLKRLEPIVGSTTVVILSLLFDRKNFVFIIKHFIDIVFVIANRNIAKGLLNDSKVLQELQIATIAKDNIEKLLKSEVVRKMFANDHFLSDDFIQALAAFTENNSQAFTFSLSTASEVYEELLDFQKGDTMAMYKLLNRLTKFMVETNDFYLLTTKQKPFLVEAFKQFLNANITDLVSEADLEAFVEGFLCDKNNFKENVQSLQVVLEEFIQDPRDDMKLGRLAIAFMTGPTVARFLNRENREKIITSLSLLFDKNEQGMTVYKGLSGFGQILESSKCLVNNSPELVGQTFPVLDKVIFRREFQGIKLQMTSIMEKIVSDSTVAEEAQDLLSDLEVKTKATKVEIKDFQTRLLAMPQEKALAEIKARMLAKENQASLFQKIQQSFQNAFRNEKEISLKSLDLLLKDQEFLANIYSPAEMDTIMVTQKAFQVMSSMVPELQLDQEGVVELAKELPLVQEQLQAFSIVEEGQANTAIIDPLLNSILDQETLQSLADILLKLQANNTFQLTIDLLALLSKKPALYNFLQEEKNVHYLVGIIIKFVQDRQALGQNLDSEDLLANLIKDREVLHNVITKLLPLIDLDLSKAMQERGDRGDFIYYLATETIKKTGQILSPKDLEALENIAINGTAQAEQQAFTTVAIAQSLVALLWEINPSSIQAILKANNWDEIQIPESSSQLIIKGQIAKLRHLDFPTLRANIASAFEQKKLSILLEDFIAKKFNKDVIQYFYSQVAEFEANFILVEDIVKSLSDESINKILKAKDWSQIQISEMSQLQRVKSLTFNVFQDYFKKASERQDYIKELASKDAGDTEAITTLQNRIAATKNNFIHSQLYQKAELIPGFSKDLLEYCINCKKPLQTVLAEVYFYVENDEASQAIQKMVAEIFNSLATTAEIVNLQKRITELEAKQDTLKAKLGKVFLNAIKKAESPEELELKALKVELEDAYREQKQRIEAHKAFMNKVTSALANLQVKTLLNNIIRGGDKVNYLAFIQELIINLGELTPEDKVLLKRVIMSLDIKPMRGFEGVINQAIDSADTMESLRKIFTSVALSTGSKMEFVAKNIKTLVPAVKEAGKIVKRGVKAYLMLSDRENIQEDFISFFFSSEFFGVQNPMISILYYFKSGFQQLKCKSRLKSRILEI